MKKALKWSEKMKVLIKILLLTALLLSVSCAATKSAKQPEQVARLFVDGTVQTHAGNELVLAMKLPEFKEVPESTIQEIARKVVQKTLFLQGIKTEVDGAPALIKEVRPNLLTLNLERPKAYPAGAKIRLKIPQKTIAIMDFEVIRGQDKEIGRVTLEGLTSALIDSGFFLVVEREKLKTILSEQELGQTGLTKETAENFVGKLLWADLILTGTLSEAGSNWDLNLRLLDVRTGQALAAIAMRAPLGTSLAMRNSNPLNEDFSKRPNPLWAIGYWRNDPGSYSVIWDRNVGADGSKGSLKIDFGYPAGLGAIKGWAGIRYKGKRDLSLYDGISFYVKATRPLIGMIQVNTSPPHDSNKQDCWIGYFEIYTEWEKIEIPFKKLGISSSCMKVMAEQYGNKPGDQIFHPDRIESMSIFIFAGGNQPIKGKIEGTIWVDKIRSY